MAQAIAAAPQRRNRVLILVAIIFATVAAVLVYTALQGQDAGNGSNSAAEMTVAVVATEDVPANTILTAEMVEVRDVPLGSQLEDVFASTAGVVGLPTRFPLEAGEQVTPQKVGLSQVEDADDVALVLPPGMRGFAVEVREVTGVGGLLLPGHHVDVIAVYGGFGETPLAETLLQDVEVIAIGQEAQEAVPPSDGEAGVSGQRPEDVERQPDATSATIAVTPVEAQELALVQQSGAAIWLSLRPVGDDGTALIEESVLEPSAEERVE